MTKEILPITVLSVLGRSTVLFVARLSSVRTMMVVRSIWSNGRSFARRLAYPSQPSTSIQKIPSVFLERDFLLCSVRYQSSSTNHSTGSSSSPSNGDQDSVEDTLNRLFEENLVNSGTASSDALVQAGAAVSTWVPAWYNPADQAIVALNMFHDYTNLPYGWSIVGLTVILRIALFPIMTSAQKTTSRMAHLQPQLTQMKNRYEALGTPSRQDQLQFSRNMQALFAKYEVNPLKGIMGPLIQLPIFMGMFFGLKKMPELFPEQLSTGGILWFPDLTVTDPMYILPITTAASFLLLIEVGKDQMVAQNPAQGQLILNMFRGLSLFMLPVSFTFESGMLCYWTSNNLMTVGQALLLKNPVVRAQLGIWEPPKAVPGQEPESLTDVVKGLAKRVRGEATSDLQRMQEHNQAIEQQRQREQVQQMLQDQKHQTSSSSASTGSLTPRQKRRRAKQGRRYR